MARRKTKKQLVAERAAKAAAELTGPQPQNGPAPVQMSVTAPALVPRPLDPADLQSTSHDSRPVMPYCDSIRVRFEDLAEKLRAAKIQGYIEADLREQLLALTREYLPKFLGIAGL